MKSKDVKKWISIPKHGDIIKEVFFPFKTPIDRTSNIPQSHWFTAKMFIEMINLKEFQIGLVIDLTQTEYYNKVTLEKNGIKYCKFPCRGFDQTPTPNNTNEFIMICDKFLCENPNMLIGVHCTHGCNRTGFLICAYLIKRMQMDANSAIKLFNDSRPPGIHKDFVTADLIVRYGQNCSNKVINYDQHDEGDSVDDNICKLSQLKLN